MTENPAACAPENSGMTLRQIDLIFGSDVPARVSQAKSLCASCSVKFQCLKLAVETQDEWMIMGGLTPSERAGLVSVR